MQCSLGQLLLANLTRRLGKGIYYHREGPYMHENTDALELGISRSHHFWLRTYASRLVPYSVIALKKRNQWPHRGIVDLGKLVKQSPFEVRLLEFKV